MEYGSKKRHVFFNLNDPTERAMYELSKRTNFSGLVKQYLARELKRQQKPPEASLKVQLGGDSK
ncbi:hypothetical protein [Alicyclobacillus dauci]|uniref:Uncharacterized protein n=1 Tax=Alicyclobacillus dauci TaxID=1475485 RepID=A0ABY6Z5U4_9BACL|nr:hypothetical protein [Alicyclobacillus dauci]WAH38254.1 hypothetical protein NZD86_07165 [Alicyclobacillus dauci]